VVDALSNEVLFGPSMIPPKRPESTVAPRFSAALTAPSYGGARWEVRDFSTIGSAQCHQSLLVLAPTPGRYPRLHMGIWIGLLSRVINGNPYLWFTVLGLAGPSTGYNDT
jgi:hypothetical protein